VSARARRGGGTGLDDGVLDHRFVRRRRGCRRASDRAYHLWSYDGTFSRGGHRVGYLLDMALGPHRAHPCCPIDNLLGRLGRHVDHLKFLDVMLGDEPALTPAELLYQRMLGGDPVEAAEQAEQFLKDQPILKYYEEILIEGLKLAQADADRGLLDDERRARVRDAVAEIVDDLSSHEDKTEAEPQSVSDVNSDTPLAHIRLTEDSLTRSRRRVPSNWMLKKPVLCIPGLNLLDEAFALIVAQSIERERIGVRTEHWDALSISRIFTLDTAEVELVCLCYLTNATSAQIRYAVKRIRRKAPAAFILVTLAWTAGENDLQTAIQPFTRVCLVQGSLGETAAKVLDIATSHPESDPLLLNSPQLANA
jgi:hypothetical protein